MRLDIRKHVVALRDDTQVPATQASFGRDQSPAYLDDWNVFNIESHSAVLEALRCVGIFN